MTDDHERRAPLPGDNRESWMMFRYGGPLQLLELTPEQIDVRDIVHGLGQINRFNGQSARMARTATYRLHGHGGPTR